MALNTPVLFLVFNRPTTTQQVFNAIRKAKPKKLYVAADGPRANKLGEEELCIKTREIINQIDWPCEVKTLFRKENLGCGKAVSSGITWFFENEEQGIILEDDCLPDPTFFSYCETLLEKYKNEEQVMMISGVNYISSKVTLKESYYFSKYFHIWGWASWRRAWEKYDFNMDKWPEFKSKRGLNEIYGTFWERFFIEKTFDVGFAKKLSTWDIQWFFSCAKTGGYSIYPAVNLITNIGFGEGSTHTVDTNSSLSEMKLGSMPIIVHPKSIERRTDIDYLNFKQAFNTGKLKILWLFCMDYFLKFIRKK